MSTVNAVMSPPSPNADINSLKAAFVYNFTKYIKWTNPGEFSTFRIGVIGDSKIRSALGEIAAKKMINNTAIEVLHFEKVKEIEFCHILFISESQNDYVDQILSKLGSAETLTIGDTEGFCERGIMINFFIENEKVKFEMNPAILEHAGLKASSQLQKLARIIQ